MYSSDDIICAFFLLQCQFTFCKICKETSVTLLYSAVLKSEMKICQKYGKNIEVKNKTERRRRKGKEGGYDRGKRQNTF